MTSLKEIYGRKIPASGPVFDAVVVHGSELWIRFKNTKGLTTTDGLPPNGFYMCGEDHVFVPAKAHIEGASVVLSSDKVVHTIAVSYAFQNVPSCLNLTNDSGLPTFPFRTDVP